MTDCGDHRKTSPVATSELRGDAHEHVRQNDCGLTGGRLFSGDDLLQYACFFCRFP